MAKESTKKLLPIFVIPNTNVKEVYAKLLRPLVQKQHLKKTIEKPLHNDDINWPEVYMIPRKVSISFSLRTFQYKILNNKQLKHRCYARLLRHHAK